MKDDFGVIIGCCKQDLRYAVGCYASIRYFMPQARICFLYDGWTTPDFIQSLPLATTLNRSNVQSEVLRERSFGPGITKMIAFFEAPFETFVFLDADTVVAGDLQRLPDWNNFDLVTDRGGTYDDASIDKWFFDTKRIGTLVPTFDFRAHRSDFFCTGTFFARKGSLSLDRYIKLLDVAAENPSTFKFWEMGLLNLMIFEAQDDGTARVNGVGYQLVVSDHEPADLRRRFEFAVEKPLEVAMPAVYHFPNPKHFVGQSSVCSVPMTFFRRRFYRQTRKMSRLRTEITLLAQDFKFVHYPWLQFAVRSRISWVLDATKLRRRSNRS